MSETGAIIPSVAQNIFQQDREALAITQIPNSLPPEERKKCLRDTLTRAKVMEDRLGLVLGELLYEVGKEEYYVEWGYEDFSAYVEEELGFKYRKAKYLVKIYEKFVIDLGLPIDELKGLEWTKAREILPIINLENRDQVLGDIKGMSHSQVRAYVKGHKEDPDPGYRRMSLTFNDEQYQTFERALEHAQRVFEFEGETAKSRAAEVLAAQFLAGMDDDEDTELEALDRLSVEIESFQKRYGVKLSIDGMAEPLEDLTEPIED